MARTSGDVSGYKVGPCEQNKSRCSEDQRRFVAQVRRALADDIERGEPLQFDYEREASRRPHDRQARRTTRSSAECSIPAEDLGGKPAGPTNCRFRPVAAGRYSQNPPFRLRRVDVRDSTGSGRLAPLTLTPAPEALLISARNLTTIHS